MREFIIEVADGADYNFLTRVFKSIEGVIGVKVKDKAKDQSDKWLDNLREARASFNKDLIDIDDERTKHLLR